MHVQRTFKEYDNYYQSCCGSILWNNLDDEIKELPTVASFKTKIKTWNGEKCNCKICK